MKKGQVFKLRAIKKDMLDILMELEKKSYLDKRNVETKKVSYLEKA